MKAKIILLLLVFVSVAMPKGDNLLIIYDGSRFGNGIQQYKMWKSLLGFDVTLKNVDDWPSPDSSTIYNYIHNTWYSCIGDYVLILGDETEVPTNYYPLSHQGYYSLITGQDTRYAHHNLTEPLMNSELAVSRIRAYNRTECDPIKILKKYLKYEYNPGSYNPTSYKSYQTAGNPVGWFEDMYIGFDDAGWDADSVYFSGHPSWTETDFFNDFTDYFFVDIFSHGGPSNASLTTDAEILETDDFYDYEPENRKWYLYHFHGCRNATMSDMVNGFRTRYMYDCLAGAVVDHVTDNYTGTIASFGQCIDYASKFFNAIIGEETEYRISEALTDSLKNTVGGFFRSFLLYQLTMGWPYGEYNLNIGNMFRTDVLYGDPSASIRYVNPTTEVAYSSYLSVSENSVIAYTGSDVGSIRISAYAPNNGWFSTVTKSGNTSHTFSTSNRPLFVSFTKDDASKKPTVWTTGGELTADTWIIGTIHINGDLIVDTGETMEILPDAEIIFKSNTDDQADGYDTGKAELIVEGTLKADDATFKSTTTEDNSWYGVVFDEATSTSYLKNCTIQRARRGVRVQDCSPTIESCDLDHNQYGLWAVGSSASPLFKKNDINYGCIGIAAQSTATPDIEDNKIRSLNECIYIHNGADPDCINNTLYGYDNGYYQVFITSSASGGEFGGWNGKGNYLTDDVRYDIVQADGGQTRFYYDVFENPSSVNQIYIDNNTGQTFDADHCYWDNGGEPSSGYFDGDVDYEPALDDTAPDAGTTWKIMNPVTPFDDGLLAYKNKDFSRAAQELRTAFENNMDHPRASWALSKLARAVRIAHEEDAYKNFFDGILANSDNDGHRQVARSFNLNYYADRKQLSTAENYALMAPEGSLFDRELLLDMVYRYALAQDEESEKNIVSLLRKRYPNDKDLEESIEWIKLPVEDDLAYLAYKGGKGMLKEYPVVTAKEFELLTAYPNPFNASTTIAFNLPERSNVKVRIYDINGRLVRALLDESMNVGQHKVIWNGDDRGGNSVSSGLYFAQVVTNETRQIVKMILAK